ALAPARAAMERRLAAALALLPAGEIAASLEDGAARAREAEALLRALDALAGQAAAIAEMGERHGVMTPLLSVDASSDESMRRLYTHALPQLQALHRALDGLLRALEGVPYPFDHAAGALSLAAFVANDLPAPINDFSAYLRAEHALSRLHAFHDRALGRLALIAEQVEAAARL
ncbi:MAG TPA: hypothetical protein VF310_08770, partial [Vicinamibacteria bacterium]